MTASYPAPSASHPPVSRLTTLAFYLLVFFVMIGPHMPFQPQVLDDGEVDFVQVGSSDRINQLFLSVIYLLILPAVYRFRTEIFRTMESEKILTIFLLWCGFTALWSPEPVTSIKRWIQLLGVVAVCYCYVHQTRGHMGLMRPLMAITGVFILASFLGVLATDGAIDYKAGGWRGIAINKNVMGQVAGNGVIIWFMAASVTRGRQRGMSVGMALLALVLLLGSRSTTSLIAVAVTAGVAGIAFVRRHLDRVGVGTVFAVLMGATIASCALAISIMDPTLFGSGLEGMGKDATFTGRLPLWKLVWAEANSHPIIGYGYGGFWVASNPKVFEIGNAIGWAPPHAHQGYLDVLNDTGYPGLLLMFGVLFVYFRSVLRGEGYVAWSYFVIMTLVLNLQESHLFGHNSSMTVTLLIAYLSMLRDRGEAAIVPAQVPQSDIRPTTPVAGGLAARLAPRQRHPAKG